MKTYHVGLLKGYGNGFHSNGHRESTLVVEARRSVDFLSPQLWLYYGERETTKADLYRNRAAILDAVNKQHGTAFTHCVID